MRSRRHHRLHGRSFRLRAVVAIAIALLASVLAVGCSTTESSSSPDEPAAIAITIHISDGEFDPREVDIETGGTVQWINDDINPHQLVSLETGELKSPVLGTGHAWTFQFTTPGDVQYYDAFRATMKGTITVR